MLALGNMYWMTYVYYKQQVVNHADAFWQPPDKAQCFKPMEEVNFKKNVNFFFILYTRPALF
jgi:hypothetical protein